MRIADTASKLWVCLILLSVLSLAVFETATAGALAGSTAIVAIAGLKSRLVILHYMEAKRAPARWRLMYETWNFACAALIVVGNGIAVLQQG